MFKVTKYFWLQFRLMTSVAQRFALWALDTGSITGRTTLGKVLF